MRKDTKIFCWACLGVSLLFLIGALQIIPIAELSATSPGGYPVFIAILCAVLAVVIVIHPKQDCVEEKALFSPVIKAFLVMLVLYVLAIIYLHYVIATLLFLFAAVLYLKRDDWRTAVLVAYISTFMVLLVFEYIFGVVLP